MSTFYVTTSIPYVNDKPHIGHAMEFIQADVLARYHRQIGDTVLFSTGSDEHGSKIAEKATEQGVKVTQLVDTNVASFKELLTKLDITNDRFIRTTDPDHEKRVQAVWNNLKDYIYKSLYVGLYCVGCEEFVTDTFAKEHNGICPSHNRPYEQIEEENYFFALSKFTDRIKTAIETGEFTVTPDSRKNEIISVLNSGLEDISISRSANKMDWGIPVPGDASQVIYVWFDALLNYITVLGYPDGDDFKTFWPANVQVVGKDIVRFHAAIWPGVLLALNVLLPQMLYVHGFITMDGKKMSKSLGNVVDPLEIIQTYGSDAFRYYFLRYIPSHADGDFTWSRFKEAYNNELANELGNAVGRVAAMIGKYQDNVIGEIPPAEHDIYEYQQAVKNCRFDKALDEVWEQVRGLNQYIDVEKPWMIAKENDEQHLRDVLAYCVSNLMEIAGLLAPFMPQTATTIANIFKDGIVRPTNTPLFPKFD